IETLPGRLDRIVAAKGPGTAGVRSIELVDGSPRGLDEPRIMRSRIVCLADSLNLAMGAGSDNHGWGRASPGWTLLIVPGWRGMRTDSLAASIERSLHQGRQATRVVERRIAGELNGGNALELTLTLPIVIWRMLATLSVDERVMWIVWVWAITVAVRLTSAWRRRRRSRPRHARLAAPCHHRGQCVRCRARAARSVALASVARVVDSHRDFARSRLLLEVHVDPDARRRADRRVVARELARQVARARTIRRVPCRDAGLPARAAVEWRTPLGVVRFSDSPRTRACGAL